MGRFSRCSQGYSDDRRISWNLHHNVSTYWKYGDQLHFERLLIRWGTGTDYHTRCFPKVGRFDDEHVRFKQVLTVGLIMDIYYLR